MYVLPKSKTVHVDDTCTDVHVLTTNYPHLTGPSTCESTCHVYSLLCKADVAEDKSIFFAVILIHGFWRYRWEPAPLSESYLSMQITWRLRLFVCNRACAAMLSSPIKFPHFSWLSIPSGCVDCSHTGIGYLLDPTHVTSTGLWDKMINVAHKPCQANGPCERGKARIEGQCQTHHKETGSPTHGILEALQ